MTALDADDPAVVGPYTVLGLLGRGGMGRVYLASGVDGRRVAVKVIRSDLASDDVFRTRFRREIEAARLVPDRHTARVLDADPDAARPWVATEYVSGPSLEAHVLARGPLGGRDLRRLSVGLFRALVALGQAGLVHRDLKPSNVLLDGGRPGRPRVVDFGIARAADETRMTSTGALVGTPAYMAPEQAIGDSEVGRAADVHAAGAILVFAATGAPPYPATSAAAVLYRKLHGEPELGVTPEPERGWAARCLARDPADRPDAERLLSEARRPVRRAVVAAVALVALIVLGGILFQTVGGGGTTPTPTPTTARAGPTTDASIPGGGPAVSTPPAVPATVDGSTVRLGHRAGRVVAGAGRTYVTDADTGAVTVLDAGGQQLGRVDAGRFPTALALSPDGTRLFLTLNTTPTRLVAVDTATFRVAGTVDLAPGSGGADVVLPADLAVTPDGGSVVVADPRSSRAITVDPVSLRPTAERRLDAVPRALAVVPGRVLVACGTPGDTTGVDVLALPGLSPVARAPGVEDALALAADGDRAFLSASGQSVSATPEQPGVRVLGTGDGRARSVLDDVGPATRLVTGPGGRWLYALDPSGGTVTVIDTTGPRVAGRVSVPQEAEDLAVSPDGRVLSVVVGDTVRTFTAPR
ncbi:protein kinase domain-containing protein [Pseudonocardia endophytica]|uniref:Serine/threonine protein kinase n=1 Tax=Pseudonocardia endophytica TaxID=401976 RepID=A0A4R1HUS7_PSEEN|nr:protein kinase [Pseudonocardia endophytica]TCK24725.1 serine/threonine protein kinase [Pseudonocardia endophytica]